MPEPPRVSVAMACHDGERFLAEQLASLGRQTRLPDELVVCDDGSTDGTARLLDSFRETAPFPVRLLRHEACRGMRKAYETALGACAGEIVFVCDQDDIWVEEKVARYLARFAARSDLALVGSDSEIIDESGRRTGDSVWRRARVRASEVRAANRGDAFRVLLRHAFLSGHGLAFRARFLPGLLPFPPDCQVDEWLNLAISAQGPVAVLPERLCRYRVHHGQSVGVGGERLAAKVRSEGARDVDGFSLQIGRCRTLAGRIGEFALPPAAESRARRLVARKVDYLEARREMRANQLAGRLRLLVRELARGSYWSVGRGWLAVARDVSSLFAARVPTVESRRTPEGRH